MSAENVKDATAGPPGGGGLPSGEETSGTVRSMVGRARRALPGGNGAAANGAPGNGKAQSADAASVTAGASIAVPGAAVAASTPAPGAAAASAGSTPEETRRREVEALRRRRDELAQQVSQQHWDLGGLTYEMAARDHFRLDVLVRRAAILQERDMELAEVDRRLRALGVETGATATPPGTPPGAAKAAVAAGTGAATTSAAKPAADAASGEGPTGTTRSTALRVGAVLLPVFLGFGALIGNATAGSGTARRPVRVVTAQAPVASASTQSAAAATGASGLSGTSGGSSSAGGSSGGAGSSSGSSGGGAGSGSGSHESPQEVSTGSEGSGGGSSEQGGSGGGSTTAEKLPAIKHVFVVMLSDESYASMFGPESKASYLMHDLEPKGELLARFYSVAHEGLADRVALISGQGPTPQTATDCATYEDLSPASAGSNGQVLGQGCVYPQATPTLASQLAAKHLTWRAYSDEAGATGGGGGCRHPALGAADPTASAVSPLATFEDPFLYFHAVIDGSSCATDDVPLSQLRGDLASTKKTPSFAFIAADRCDDGSPQPCAAGHASGPAATSGFLKSVTGEILASPAYRKDGLLVITTDQAPASGEFADSTSCCGQPTFPNMPASTGIAGTVHGGGEVGALLLSPFVKGGKVENEEAFSTFSLLRTFEDLFGVSHLGYAGLKEVTSLPPKLFTKG